MSPRITPRIVLESSTILDNTGMYTKESSQQTFKIPNNNLDVRFKWAYQNHNNEIVQTRKKKATVYDGKVSKHNNFDAQDPKHDFSPQF